jgi:trehalose synthase
MRRAHSDQNARHNTAMRPVEIYPTSLDRLASLLAPERALRLGQATERTRVLLTDRTMWHVNATAQGGGVAEMLETLLGYARGTGVDVRWLTLEADPEFFTMTKRIHNRVHGEAGDGGPLEMAQRRHYEEVMASNLDSMSPLVRSGDVVVLHDPQTAGLVPRLQACGAKVVWRSHIGRDTDNEHTEQAWAFLRPYVEQADALVFSRKSFCPDWVAADRLHLIPPSIDPFSPKNVDLEPTRVAAVLVRSGLISGHEPGGDFGFLRRDGTAGLVRRRKDLLLNESPPPADARLVVQISRWDRLKDMAGVLHGFVEHLADLPDDVHLMLAGPAVDSVSDDPEGAEVFAECEQAWRALPPPARRRTHLARLPMDDPDENAHMTNALQRHASVVVQKSLVEAFGLTVTEVMWKARPVIASRVGGIIDQITDGQDGLLLDNPKDLDDFAHILGHLLSHQRLAAELGQAARARVQDHYIGDRHLVGYAHLLDTLFGSER